jgi:Ca2+-binding EF-hand superfamily protein
VRGDCWRLDNCVYLHKVEDFNKQNEQANEKTIDGADIELGTSMEDEENTELDYSDEENLLEDFGSGPTTDEILQMYENVEINNKEGANQITTEEILKLYETTEIIEEQIPLKKSSKKQSRSIV